MRAEEVVQAISKLTKSFSADKIIPGVVTLLFSGIVIYIIRAFLIKSLRRKKEMDNQQKKRFVKIVTTVLAILAIVIVVGGYGLKTSSLMAILGVAGLAMSLSVQGLLSNFFSGCILPITRPFREGDIIEVCGQTGIIEHIGYVNTTIVTIDNVTAVIPNSSLTSGTIVNYSAKETLQVEHAFTVVANVPDEDVRTAFREAIRKDSRFLTDSEPFIHLKSFDSMNATYIVRVPCKSKDYFEMKYAIVENVRASFEEHSIEIGNEMLGMYSSEQSGGRGGTVQQPSGADGNRGGTVQQIGGADGNRGGSGRQRGSADS